MNKMRVLLCLSSALIVAACTASSAQTAKTQAPGDVVAVVGSSPITLAEVDEKALQQPVSNFGGAKLSQALYEARVAALDNLVANRLFDQEAKARHVDRAALIETEITSKIVAVTDADVALWYQTNQNRVQGASL